MIKCSFRSSRLAMALNSKLKKSLFWALGIYIVTFAFQWSAYALDSSSEVSKSFVYFKDASGVETNKVSIAFFHDRLGKMTEKRGYNLEQEMTSRYLYDYSIQNKVIISEMVLQGVCKGQIKSRYQRTLENFENNEDEVIWYYDQNKCHLKFADYIADDIFRSVFKKVAFDNKGQIGRITHFERNDQGEITGFKTYDPQGKLMASYSLAQTFNLQKIYGELSREKIHQKIEQQRNPDRVLLGVIDSGFDIQHPDLASKLWSNPQEIENGLDDDANGFVDDFFGWNQQNGSGLPLEMGESLAKDRFPMSHGTHVAHIATRNLEGVALFGFAGDFTQDRYIDQISAFLKKAPFRVINMSFSIAKGNSSRDEFAKVIRRIGQMIETNPHVLFVAAAGNDSKNLDKSVVKLYPASFRYPNLITVGAVLSKHEKGKVTKSDAHYRAEYSNYGSMVDLYAPGDKIRAASLGGGQVVHTGTSMSSPYVAREALKILLKDPQLKPEEVKKKILEQAQLVPDSKLGQIRVIFEQETL